MMKHQRSPLFAARKRAAVVTCVAMASLSMGGNAIAQAFPPTIELPPGIPVVQPAPVGGFAPTVAPTAAGAYLATPAWSQTLAPNVRFVILSNFDSNAVLDRETGLVWARKTVADVSHVGSAAQMCRTLGIGNRLGWRLPTIAELQSLVDLSMPVTLSVARLPTGHPFSLPASPSSPSSATLPFLTAETLEGPNLGIDDILRWYVNLFDGSVTVAGTSNNVVTRFGVLCVRGHDANRHSAYL